MKEPRLPVGGTDLFDEIKTTIAEHEKNTGRRLIPLAVGQPSGPAFEEARRFAADAALRDDEAGHCYQDIACPAAPDFAEHFIQTHVATHVKNAGVKCLALAGVKSALKLVIFASRTPGTKLSVRTMTAPGYGVPATWCNTRIPELVSHRALPTTPQNEFLFDPETELSDMENGLVMINYPHSPSGQVSPREWLERLCEVCRPRNIRIVSDAVYALLDHSGNHTTLTDVAVNFPDLSWLEMFSASKELCATGWRIAAAVGSTDFIADLRTVKTSDDAGPTSITLRAADRFYREQFHLIEEQRKVYERRLVSLMGALRSGGMRLAAEPKAGFFTLWHTPRRAWGEEVTSAREFNYLMLERANIFGVHFPPYVRYAVAGDLDAPGVFETIRAAFEEARISYD